MTARQDFTIDAGRDYGLVLALFEADLTTPLNLQDCELEWIITAASGQTALVNKSSLDPDEIEITSPDEGLATIHVHASDTADLGMLTCQHELIVIDAAHLEATVMRGLVTIIRSLIQHVDPG